MCKIRYQVISNADLTMLQKVIDGYIEAGWIPQGGICIETIRIEKSDYYGRRMVEFKYMQAIYLPEERFLVQ